ncbi:MAG: Scr1 family TA system antitoxin-like transcriptional regulator [Pseudonocardiaceae bacterium]
MAHRNVQTMLVPGLPQTAEYAHAATAGPFHLMEFATFRPVVYLESVTASVFLAKPEQITAYRRIPRALAKTALSEEAGPYRGDDPHWSVPASGPFVSPLRSSLRFAPTWFTGWSVYGTLGVATCGGCVRSLVVVEVFVVESRILDTLELDGVELLTVDNDEELSMGHGVTEIGASGPYSFPGASMLV